MTAALIIIILYLAILCLSFLATAGLAWLVCWAFSLVFSWKIAIGVWAILALLSGVFNVTIHKER